MSDGFDAGERSTEFDGPEDAAGRLVEATSTHAIFRLDAGGRITTWPEPARELYGYDPGAVLDCHLSTLFPDGDDENDPGAALDEAGREAVVVEGWHERADGSVFWGMLTLSPIDDGEFEGYAAVCRDATAEREYRQMLERQNDRLKEFTDILVHDLRNPLGVVEQRLTLYRETGDEAHLDHIDETTDRMARLVDDLLHVARQGNVVRDRESIDLRDVIDTAMEGTGPPAERLHYEPVRPVSADPDRLRELFENLLKNAVEHGGENVVVRIGPLEDGFYVEDDGPGIPADLGEEVFSHGVSTNEDGTGYGLSIVRTIASAHGWDVDVTGAAGGGARFEVTGIEFVD